MLLVSLGGYDEGEERMKLFCPCLNCGFNILIDEGYFHYSPNEAVKLMIEHLERKHGIHDIWEYTERMLVETVEREAPELLAKYYPLFYKNQGNLDQMSGLKWRKCRKKPVIVEFSEIQREIKIKTREGFLTAKPDQDFLIRGVDGEYYPIKKEIFYKTYEIIDQEDNLEEIK